MNTKQTFSSGSDDINVHAILGVVVDNRWTIAGIAAVVLFLSLLYAILATPIYEATAIVQVEQKAPSLPGMQDLSQTLGVPTSQAVTEIQLLTSRLIIGQAIDNLNLDTQVSPKRFPVIGGFLARHFAAKEPGKIAQPVLGLNSYDWGGTEISIPTLQVAPSWLDKSLRLVAGDRGSYTLYDDDDNLLLSGKVGMPASGHGITMLVSRLQANDGARFDVKRQSHLTTVAQLQKSIEVSEQGKDSGVIQLQYHDADPLLAAALLNQVTTLYVNQNVDRSSSEAASSLAFVREQLPKVKKSLEQATNALNAFQLRAKSVDVGMQTQSLLDHSVQVDKDLEQLRVQMSDTAAHFTPNHPTYRALAQQISTLEKEKGSLEQQIGSLPNTQQELLRLTRDVTVSNQTYTTLLTQEQQLDIARAGSLGNVRVVDVGQANVAKPWWPKKPWIVLGGALVGVFVGLAAVFLRQGLRRGVEDAEAVEDLGLPVYVAIPSSLTQRKFAVALKRRIRADSQRLLAVHDPADMAVEALRSLRTSLHFARMDSKNNVLMIASSSPGVGKSFVACNLAVVLAQAGQRVLLIDADMRKGMVHDLMGGKAERGLSELVAGKEDLATTLRSVSRVEKLSYIARGKIPANPSELLMGAGFSTLIERLKPRFDLIIIDTPPILAVTDAAVVGRHAGTSLLVVGFGKSQVRDIAQAKKQFEQNGVMLKGAVFNLVEKRSASPYAYAYESYATSES